jgi:mono/diheme cytochrome c family protein
MVMKDLLIGLGLLSGPAVVFAVFGTSGFDAFTGEHAPASGQAAAEAGRLAFTEFCIDCHGRLAEGTDRGPDLIAPRFGRALYSDDAFRGARYNKETQHAHADAGAKGAPAFSEVEVDQVLAYVRSLQKARGID